MEAPGVAEKFGRNLLAAPKPKLWVGPGQVKEKRRRTKAKRPRSKRGSSFSLAPQP